MDTIAPVNETCPKCGRDLNCRHCEFEYKCLRCGYEWNSLKNEPPLRCANSACRSPYWDKPRKEKKNGN